MLGATSIPGTRGTGATDNGAGPWRSMEAVRILKALGLKPRRTIRIASGAARSKGCSARVVCRAAFRLTARPAPILDAEGDPHDLRRNAGPVTIKPETEPSSRLFQPGQRHRQDPRRLPAGKRRRAADLRGVAGAVPRHGRDTLTIRNTGGTDHLSFDAVGLPGFQFIQDPIEYDTLTHHSEHGRLRPPSSRGPEAGAVIVASFVYRPHSAIRCCRASRSRRTAAVAVPGR